MARRRATKTYLLELNEELFKALKNLDDAKMALYDSIKLDVDSGIAIETYVDAYAYSQSVIKEKSRVEKALLKLPEE